MQHSLNKGHHHVEHVGGAVHFVETTIILMGRQLADCKPLELLDLPFSAWYKVCGGRDAWNDVQTHILLTNGRFQEYIGVNQG